MRTMTETGVALVTALLLLLVMTIIGIAGISTSSLELRMAGNTQLFYDSFQSADAGLTAAMSQPTNFDGTDKGNIFSPSGSNALKNIIGANVGIERYFESVEMECPRVSNASSVGLFKCEYYGADSQYETNNAPTHVYQGVAREVLAN